MSRIDDAVRAEVTALDCPVAVLVWPEEAERLTELALAGTPRLLLVSRGAEPPTDWDRLTDWVRLPVDDRDLVVRIAALRRCTPGFPPPKLDEFDVLWRGSRWTALAPIEARLVQALLDRSGRVVSRGELGAAAWPDGMPAERSIDARLTSLRVRLNPLGVRICSVRRRGLLLEIGDPPDTPTRGGGIPWSG